MLKKVKKHMKDLDIKLHIQTASLEELSEVEQDLIAKAKEATFTSYAPYSRFKVGAACLLDSGKILTGSNQENAAYPSGLCAERTLLFYAGAAHPEEGVQTLAIAARNEADRFTRQPIVPCGACRQVMLETQSRSHHNLRILLYGEDQIYLIDSVEDILPLAFHPESMNP